MVDFIIFEFDEDALNKDVLTSLNSYLTNMFSEPSDNDMITYIKIHILVSLLLIMILKRNVIII